MTFDPHIHNRKSVRLKEYDYSQTGLYFITLCCHDRFCHFGCIENGEMTLNDFGQIAYNEWLKTPQIPPNVELYEFVVMPNHIHGIIHISDAPIGTDISHAPQTQTICNAGNQGVCNSPLRSPSKSIGAIVRGYKSAVTKQLGNMGFDGKLWQRNYYEHIIRNEHSYQRIVEYIITNPAKWFDDEFFS